MAPVLSGLDVLRRRLPSLLRGRRVGLLCHQASVTRDLEHAADAIDRLPGVRLRALFAPEHGLTGAARPAALAASRSARFITRAIWSGERRSRARVRGSAHSVVSLS